MMSPNEAGEWLRKGGYNRVGTMASRLSPIDMLAIMDEGFKHASRQGCGM